MKVGIPMNIKILFLLMISICLSMTIPIHSLSAEVNHDNENIILTKLGYIDTIGQANDVIVKGDIAYVSDMGLDYNTTGGLYIFNVSDPNHPTQLGYFYDGGRSHKLQFLNESILLIGDNTGGLEIFDVSNSSNPTKIGNFKGANYINGLAIVGKNVLATSFTEGVIVVDISNLSHPIELSRFSLTNVQPISLYENYAFVSGSNGLHILDISDLSNITEISTYDYDISNIIFKDDLAYAACSGSILAPAQGFKIFNISDVKNIQELGTFDTGGHPTDLYLEQNYVFVSDYDKGIDVLNINNSSQIIEETNFFDGGNALGLTFVNNLLYVANGKTGLEILKMELTYINSSSDSVISKDSQSTNSSTDLIVSRDSHNTPGYEITYVLLPVIFLTIKKKRNHQKK